MDYPTLNGKLIMPEYGRNIQRMVEYAQTIEDRDERAKCAQSIITTIGNLFPSLRDVKAFKPKLWAHIEIMSDFKLDLYYPYEIVPQENFYTRPATIPYKK